MKKPRVYNCFGFTIMELLVVIVMTSIIAGFAIPGYQRTRDRAEEQDMLANLQMIYEAQLSYEQEHGEWFPLGASGNVSVSELNEGLHLNIIDYRDVQGYTCDGSDNCWAIGDPGWQILLTPGEYDLGNNPCCDSGACPTVPDC